MNTWSYIEKPFAFFVEKMREVTALSPKIEFESKKESQRNKKKVSKISTVFKGLTDVLLIKIMFFRDKTLNEKKREKGQYKRNEKRKRKKQLYLFLTR